MTQTQDLCPINDSGNHRYFIFKVVEVFEPSTNHVNRDSAILYEKVEYAVSGCNCGSAIKQKVVQK
jgi:hypothetical protein